MIQSPVIFGTPPGASRGALLNPFTLSNLYTRQQFSKAFEVAVAKSNFLNYRQKKNVLRDVLLRELGSVISLFKNKLI